MAKKRRKISAAKERFIQLTKKKERMSKQWEKLNREMGDLADKIGMGEMFQDPRSGVIYKIVKPRGVFVTYKEWDYQRTSKPKEDRSGSRVLSRAEARMAGYDT